ncbi:MAG: hypothetical protein KGI04_00215 [Candidatus Micrarchaeota archaeon]|nr:hypothetical protein [Candidatus Micrarchaeota archaeon]
MIAQLSVEVLVSMAVALLVAAVLLHYFSTAHRLIAYTQAALSSVANASVSYPSRLGTAG